MKFLLEMLRSWSAKGKAAERCGTATATGSGASASYDPTRPHSPRERYEQLQADRLAQERRKSDDQRLLEAWASYSDAEVLAAARAGNQRHADKELRKRVARLRGLLPPETEAERQARRRGRAGGARDRVAGRRGATADRAPEALRKYPHFSLATGPPLAMMP